MKATKKIKVGVLRGGPSSEYEVSLKTGETVLKNLPEKYKGVDIFISKDGEWHIDGIVKKPADALRHIDVIWNALHGEYGEDGKVQRILEHLKIPYTGSGSFESALAMNKHLTKKVLKEHKIKMAHHKLVTKEDVMDLGLHELFKTISLPCVIKPTRRGSSVGVSVVKDFYGLDEAFKKAFKVDDSVIIEEFIGGREATCGVVDNFRGEPLYALFPIEILSASSANFYDYDSKYISDNTKYVCPAIFDEKTKSEIQRVALLAHKALGLKHYSRSDFIVHPKRGVYFLEVNTLPGMTAHSLVPKALEASGTSLSDFLEHVLKLAMSRK